MDSETRTKDSTKAQPLCACVAVGNSAKGGRIYIERCAMHHAAPALLEALEAILQLHAFAREDDAVVAKGRAAIAVATGGEQ